MDDPHALLGKFVLAWSRFEGQIHSTIMVYQPDEEKSWDFKNRLTVWRELHLRIMEKFPDHTKEVESLNNELATARLTRQILIHGNHGGIHNGSLRFTIETKDQKLLKNEFLGIKEYIPKRVSDAVLKQARSGVTERRIANPEFSLKELDEMLVELDAIYWRVRAVDRALRKEFYKEFIS
jgi:hypothetical protein